MANETRSEKSWIDDVATEFDRAWNADREPRIEEYLNEVEEPLRARLLRELLLIRARSRWPPAWTGRGASSTPWTWPAETERKLDRIRGKWERLEKPRA